MDVPVNEEQIRTLAFYLWENDGCPEGHSDEYWEKAHRQLLADAPAAASGAESGTGARIVGSGRGQGPGPEVMAAATLDGNRVISSDHEDVGKISDIMLDVRNGRVAYAVLSEGGFLGMGTTLHAIPWGALTLDTDEQCFRVDIAAQQLKDDPGFDRDHWPSMADATWGAQIHKYYDRQPYWAATRDIVAGRESAADV